MTAEELYGIFGKYGAVYQIRLGERHKDTRGTAFVVYEDIYDAKAAVDHLSGFNVGGKFIHSLVLLCLLCMLLLSFLGMLLSIAHLPSFFSLKQTIRTISGGLILPTRKVPTPRRGSRKTKRIGGTEAEGPKEKGTNGGSRKLKAKMRRDKPWNIESILRSLRKWDE